MNPRIVADTTVLVSGMFFETGNEAGVLALAIDSRVQLLASIETLEELREVLSRPKFKLSPAESLAAFQLILTKCEVILDVHEAEVKCRDVADQKFLDCTHTGRADYLVTGDPDLLDIRQVGRTRILTASQFVKELKNNPLFKLKPVRFRNRKPVRVRSGRRWGRESFPDAGKATFGG